MNRDIRLRLEGALLEKLVQRALSEGAVFARIRRPGRRCMIIETDLRSARLFLELCRRYGYNCREEKRSGCTALLDALRKRWTLLPGIALGLLICLLVLTRVWLVDIEPTADLAPDIQTRLLECLRENGVHAGMLQAQIDTDLLQKQLLAQVDGLNHAAVRLQGIRLLVEARAQDAAPRVYEIENTRDLIALRSGVIARIDVYSGEACVQAGDTVLRGDTLIRGEESVGKNTETGEAVKAPLGARGRVLARSWIEGSAEAPLTRTETAYTGKSGSALRIALMNFSRPLTECAGFASQEIEREILPIVGLFLPLQVERLTHRETTKKEIPLDRNLLQARLEALARADALRKIEAQAGEYEIIASWTEASENNNTLQIRAVYEICTDIAAERDVLTEEVY